MKTYISRVILLLIIISGIILAIIYSDNLNVEVLQNWIKNAGSAAPLIFIMIYITATVFFLPGSVLTLAGGALFGPVMGTFYNLSAATIGAMLAFLISRYLASDWVANKTGKRVKQLMMGVEKEGWHFVAFMRLVPLFPFNLLNYALGLTRIKFLHYSLTTYIAMLPGAFAYTYLGYIGKEAATGGEGLIKKILFALALLAIIYFLPRMISSLRKSSMISIPDLKTKLDNGEDILIVDVRSGEDFNGEQRHIKGAINIPLNELKQRAAELSKLPERTIVTICRTDRMSGEAAQILVQQGFTHVHVAIQGMTEWNTKRYPIA